MPRFSLLKLVDEALLPVFLIFGAKFAGIFFANLTFGLTWELSWDRFSSSTAFIQYNSLASFNLANEFGTAATFLIIAIGMGWVLYRFLHLRLEASHPGILQRLLRSGKEELLIDNFEVYHQLVSWTALTWFVFVLATVDFLGGGLSIAIFSFCLGIFLSLIFLTILGLSKKD